MTDHDLILQERHAQRAQELADPAYRTVLGIGAPARLSGEPLNSYRVRLVNGLKGFSDTWKRATPESLAGLGAAGALDVAAEQVFADAIASVRSNRGPLRKVTEVDPNTGQRITRFYGDPNGWLKQFQNPDRYLTGINTRGQR